ncbi:MAG: aldehyde dehydrogenase family protein, partial [Salibacteraceae bacterium]
MEKLLNYIDGSLVEPISNQYFENFEPATGKPYSLIPDSGIEDVELATKAAQKAFPIWSKMSIQERSDILLKVAQLIGERKEALAQAESRDNGKPVKLARTVDIPRAQANFHFYAT